MLLKGCLCETEGVNTGDVNLMSIDQEWQLGRELAAEVLQQVEVIHDPLVQAYVDDIGVSIVSGTELAERTWTFYVVADTSVNAFNIPGGHVFVNSGLIGAAASPHEVAGVMAHEVAHGVARHSTEQMTQAYGINLIARLLMGGEVNLLEQIAAQLIGSGTMAKFSRDDEREADRLGLDYMAEAGFDPQGMATMFESMLTLRRQRPTVVDRFFATHPMTEERIADVSERAESRNAQPREVSTERFAEIQERLADHQVRHWESSARPAP